MGVDQELTAAGSVSEAVAAVPPHRACPACRKHVVEKVLKLLQRKERWLVVAGVRFLRTCVGTKVGQGGDSNLLAGSARAHVLCQLLIPGLAACCQTCVCGRFGGAAA